MSAGARRQPADAAAGRISADRRSAQHRHDSGDRKGAGRGPIGAPLPRTDGPDEGAFIACTCWLADCLAKQGRRREARSYLERLVGLANDVGLLSEQWDTRPGLMLGNFSRR